MPTWTTPVMKWAKAQGGVTGYAHSASGLKIDARAAAGRLLTPFDANHDALLAKRMRNSLVAAVLRGDRYG